MTDVGGGARSSSRGDICPEDPRPGAQAQSLAGVGEMGRLRLSAENGQPQWRAGRQGLGYQVSFMPGYRIGTFSCR